MRVVLGLVLGLGASFATPALAGQFDGKWIAEVPAQGNCNYTGTMTMMVMDDAIQGQIHNPGNVISFVGKIDADGSGTILVDNKAQGTVSFTGGHFDADWPNRQCSRHAEGDRAMDEAQQASLAADRKRHQDNYADLMQRANNGEKVDYTVLRAESVYAADWDFYDDKLGTLLAQANAAAKGKDCAKAMERTGQILKVDFTVDAAHAIRADCLDDSDRAKSKAESAIADGLIHSLMDSGDGDTEKNAYVVSTLREEMDVLANRHIQIKTRQTAVRGSDGHFYDQIQGVSLRNGSISTKIVYFNVDSFVAGRESKRAALAAVDASIH